MIVDPVAAVLRSLASGGPSIAGAVAFAGLATSAGPCTATRMLAVCSLTQRGTAHARLGRTFAFAAGAIAGYVAIGTLSGFALQLARATHVVYLAIAAASILSAYFALRPSHRGHGEAAACSPGAALLFGTGLSLVGSPCCMPIVFAITAYGARDGDALRTAALLGAFAAGHLLPVVLAGAAGTMPVVVRVLRPGLPSRVTALASATILLFLAGYYLCLA